LRNEKAWQREKAENRLTENLNENVDKLTSLRARAEQGVSHHQRRVERMAAELGRPRSFYIIALFAAAWVGLNLLAIRLGIRPLDPPPFSVLQGLVGLGALLMTTTVLTAQNRQTRDAEQRGQLELQVNLLAEQKIAKLIALLEELRRDIPSVQNRVDEIAEVMQEPVDPHAVISALEHTLDAKAQPPRAVEGPGAPPEPKHG
jgi:uncharacterized membrane protein